MKMVMTDDTWYVVRNIRGVTGFVGPASKPVPLTEARWPPWGMEKKRSEVNFAVGDSVKITGGYLDGFIGVVEEIDTDVQMVRVTFPCLVRDVTVELLDQVRRE